MGANNVITTIHLQENGGKRCAIAIEFGNAAMHILAEHSLRAHVLQLFHVEFTQLRQSGAITRLEGIWFIGNIRFIDCLRFIDGIGRDGICRPRRTCADRSVTWWQHTFVG